MIEKEDDQEVNCTIVCIQDSWLENTFYTIKLRCKSTTSKCHTINNFAMLSIFDTRSKHNYLCDVIL